MASRKRKIALLALLVLGLLIAAAFLVPFVTSGVREVSPLYVSSAGETATRDPAPGEVLKVLTLNLGHGRGTGPNQLLQGTAAIRAHLDEVAEMLKRVRPDVVALQEADGPSFWSGWFDHVKYLADKGGFPYHARGEHVKGLGLSYGTAFLSRHPLRDGLSVSFRPSPPTFNKGFVVYSLLGFECGKDSLDLVSVHLDFLREQVRKRQVKEMIRVLSGRKNPLIVMGDFNCAWTDEDSPLRALAEGLELSAYESSASLTAGSPTPGSPAAGSPAAGPPTAGATDGSDLVTFPTTNRRLDWVLISRELSFKRYEVLKEDLSDHRPVLAEIIKNRGR